MKKKNLGVLEYCSSFYNKHIVEWQTASVIPELINVKEDQIILLRVRQRSSYINTN